MKSALGTEAIIDSEQALVRFIKLHYEFERGIAARTDTDKQRDIMDECDALLRRYGAQWAFDLARLTGAEKSRPSTHG